MPHCSAPSRQGLFSFEWQAASLLQPGLPSFASQQCLLSLAQQDLPSFASEVFAPFGAPQFMAALLSFRPAWQQGMFTAPEPRQQACNW